MSFLFRKNVEPPTPESALPGRDTAMPVTAPTSSSARPSCRPSRRATSASWSAWAASGVPSASSGRHPASTRRPWATRAVITPNPTYEEACSGRTGHTEVSARRLRSRAHELRRSAPDLLGGPRPDPGHAAGQRRRLPVPLGALLARRAPARGGARLARHVPGRADAGGLRDDHDGARRGGAVLLRRGATTSSTSQRTRTGTAGSAARASAARSARASRRRKSANPTRFGTLGRPCGATLASPSGPTARPRRPSTSCRARCRRRAAGRSRRG